MANAPLDPLGRPMMTPEDLASTFQILRANVVLNEFSRFPRCEDLHDQTDRVFFNERDLPEVVVFLSHRWLGPSHPDPEAGQLGTIKSFLSSVGNLCAAQIATGAGRGGLLARLADRLLGTSHRQIHDTVKRVVYSHGGFQAAYFLGNYSPFAPDRPGRRGLFALGDRALDKVGLWYDFTCLPQAELERGELVASLARLHELLNASNLIALRAPGDDYGSRAWCAAEAATDPDIERTRFRKLCLRMDLIGDQFGPDLLREQPPQWEGIADVAMMQIDSADDGAEAAHAVTSFIDMVGADAEDGRDIPLFFLKRKPWIFRGQREFMIYVMDALARASEDNGSKGQRPGRTPKVDLVGLAKEAANHAGLKTSNDADIPYTALMILYARHRGAPQLAALFAEGLERHLDGRTTVLRHYHENREAHPPECEYRFDD